MIVYKVTVEISSGRESEWVAWMRDVHIPEVMATGSFEGFEFSRSLSDSTYTITYRCRNENTYQEYQKAHSSELQKKHSDRFGGDFKATRELLKVLKDKV